MTDLKFQPTKREKRSRKEKDFRSEATVKLEMSQAPGLNYRKRGSASYIVREVLLVRERYRERERDRRKWRHHCRAKIGDEFTLSLAKESHNWRWAYTFPCQKFAQLAMSLHFPLPKIRIFRFSLPTSILFLHGEVTMVALKFAMSSHFPLPKNFRPQALFPLFQMAPAARRVIENPRQNDQILPSPILFFPSKNWIKLIPKTIGNRKRDCAWGGSGW